MFWYAKLQQSVGFLDVCPFFD
jgi:hypothetical protein